MLDNDVAFTLHREFTNVFVKIISNKLGSDMTIIVYKKIRF